MSGDKETRFYASWQSYIIPRVMQPCPASQLRSVYIAVFSTHFTNTINFLHHEILVMSSVKPSSEVAKDCTKSLKPRWVIVFTLTLTLMFRCKILSYLYTKRRDPFRLSQPRWDYLAPEFLNRAEICHFSCLATRYPSSLFQQALIVCFSATGWLRRRVGCWGWLWDKF